MVPAKGGTDGPCRVLLLSGETEWYTQFKDLTKRLACRIKRLDSPVDALIHFHEFDPHIFLVGGYDSRDMTLLDICDALRVPRMLRPLALIVTTDMAVPVGEDLAELGIDEVFDTGVPPERFATSLLQHFKVAVSQRKVLDRERDILDSLPDALIVVDAGLVIWTVNRAFATMFGIEDVEKLRRHLGEPLLSAIHASGLDAGLDLFRSAGSALRGGRGTFECREILRGEERFLAGQITRLEGSDDHALIALHDVTDREQAMLREARRERLATIGNLSVGVAHEIQNPNTFSRVNAANLKLLLNALRPALEDLAHSDPTRKIGVLPLPTILEKISEAVQGIEMASSRIATTLDTLKAFGKKNDDVSDTDVLEAIAEAVVLTRHVLRGRIDLDLDMPDRLPAVRAAVSELVQVFVNLIENAAQAFEQPGQQARGNDPARISIHLEKLDENELVIAVADNGPGIEESVQSQIFRPYFTTRAQGEGTGLGLSISSDILHRFGGDLIVRSRRGRGATFLITLKRADANTSGFRTT
jgi:PAS domain S-box-containing protein